MTDMATDLLTFIRETEAKMFRTDMDYGANPNALLVWNQVRKHAGLSELTPIDLTENHLKVKVEDLIRNCAEDDVINAESALQTILELASCIAAGETMSSRVKAVRAGGRVRDRQEIGKVRVSLRHSV